MPAWGLLRLTMSARLPFVVGALLFGLPGVAAAAGPPDFADLAERMVPSVVNISSSQGPQAGSGPRLPPGSRMEEFFREYFGQREQEPENEQRQQPQQPFVSSGSGFVISAEGHVVTNDHVINKASEITVTLSDGTELEARVVGRDPKTDVALLKVESETPLTPVVWGDSDTARVGNWVVAVGNPFGLGGTVTAGIISARGRDINAGPFDNFIQTDASINRGNSGGPLINMDGEVIGINTAIYTPTGGSVGIGFSLPANLARNVVAQLLQFGETRRGWLGVRIQTVTSDLAANLGLESATGALVASVVSGSPAAAAGIEIGDVILEFDGKPIETMRRLPRVVAETVIDKEVDVLLWRNGEEVHVGVTVGLLEEGEVRAEQPPPEPELPVQDVPEMGLTLSALTDELREKFEIGEEKQGVLVVAVAGGSTAAEKGLQAGDIIVEVGQQSVAAPGDVAARIADHRNEDKNTALLLLDRQGDLRFVAVRLADE